MTQAIALTALCIIVDVERSSPCRMPSLCRQLLAVMSVGLLPFLGGCSSSEVVESRQQDVVITERYVGKLPCEGCRLIRADVTVKRDAETGLPAGFFMHQTRVDSAQGNVSSTLWGDWQQEHHGDDVLYRFDTRDSEITLRRSDKGDRLEWVSEVQDGQADVDFALRQAKPLL